MSDTAAALVIQLSADFKTMQKEMRKAVGSFDTEGRKIERRQQQLRKNLETGFTGMGKTLTGALSVAAVVQFGRYLLNTADALSDASAQLGVTTQQLQGLDYAARTSGASSEKLTQALGFLSDGLGDAQKGEGDLAKFMRENNIAMGDTIDVLYDIAERTKNATTQQEKMNIATTAFGAKAGKTMVSFLDQGADGLRRLQEEASAKGQIWDAATLARLDAVKDNLETLQKAAVNLAALPASEFLADLTKILEVLAGGDWRAGLEALAHQLPTIGGAVAGGLTFGLPGAVVGGGIGAIASHFIAPHDDPAAAGAAQGRKRTAVPLSKSDRDSAARNAQKALDDAQRVREMLAGMAEESRQASDAVMESSRDVVRTQNEGLLQMAQGWSNYAQIQKEVIEENAKLDIQSTEARRDAALRALEVRAQEDRNRLKELNATLADMEEAEANFEKQRVAITQQASKEIMAIRQQEADNIKQIRTREMEVQEEFRRGLIEIGLAARHGFGDLEDAAMRALDAVIDLIIELYVLKPLLESIGLSQGGGGGGGSFGGLLGGLFGGGGGGMDFSFGASFFANGGVMTPNGPRALGRYAGGGVSRRPAIFGEAGPEAAVPLPDGRRIPVDLRLPSMPAGSAGGGVTVVQQIDLSGAVVTDELFARMERTANSEAQKAVATYDRNVVPGRVRQLNGDPRRNY